MDQYGKITLTKINEKERRFNGSEIDKTNENFPVNWKGNKYVSLVTNFDILPLYSVGRCTKICCTK